ncbi:unnamed protein product [Euphydryas editha]|uniref:BZIP domain-containing protein n=1 Tax=Euphydryas editha TaxID=104508 RepID=A0AAU9TSK8_EUPED|nr:unnamed protein product [Euphydryas editha]
MSLWRPYVVNSPLDLPLEPPLEPPVDLPLEPLVNLSVKRKASSSASSATPVIVYPQYSSYSGQGDTVQGINHCQSTPYSSAQLPIVNPPVRVGVLSPPYSPDSENSRNCPNFMADADNLENDPDFQAFARHALKAMAEKNGGSLLCHNPRMRRVVQTGENEDEFYRKERENNNLAAKRSRDKRKLREIELALKVAYLSNKNAELRARLSSKLCMNCGKPI